MDITTVGEQLSVGSDIGDLSGAGGFDLLVLASVDHQHYGEKPACEIFRVPLTDSDKAPTMDTVQRAQAAAVRIAFTMSPYKVPWSVYEKFVRPANRLPRGATNELETPKKVLITCEMGMNRSLWLAGMVLVLTGEQDTGKSAREYLQTLRGGMSFENHSIRKLLDDYMPEWMKAMRGPTVKARASGEPTAPAPGGFKVE
jgi:hypothetical protein